MTDKGTPLERLGKTRVVVVVRGSVVAGFCELAGELGTIGLDVHEITLTTPGALGCIEDLRTRQPQLLVGAGTVLTVDDAKKALAAGARFVVSPTLNERVVDVVQTAGAVAIPGAMTPTEVYAVTQAGTDAVKIFPAFVGGPDYIKALRGPLPDVRFVPTGGISVETAADYLRAGAFAVCLGTAFLNSTNLARGEYGKPLKQAVTLISELERIPVA